MKPRSPASESALVPSGMTTLATANDLNKLTLGPLRALCVTHGVDYGLSGKPKPEVITRLLTIRKVTSTDLQRYLAQPASPAKKRGGGGAAKRRATMMDALEHYFSAGGKDLLCKGCDRPLSRVQEMNARYNGTFVKVSCGRYPNCKAYFKLDAAYGELCRQRCPRLLFEAHSLRGINGATHDAFSVSVQASCAELFEELMTRYVHPEVAKRMLRMEREEDLVTFGRAESPRRGVLFRLQDYDTVLACACQMLKAKKSLVAQRAALPAAAAASTSAASISAVDAAPFEPFRITGLPEMADQLDLFRRAAGLQRPPPLPPQSAGATSATSRVRWYGEDDALATVGTARLEACGLWGKLRSYQQEGVRRALQMGGTAMLADEMGLGKTLTALAVVAALDAWPCLAIVPAVTRRGWAEEAERWLGGIVTPSDVHIMYDQYDALEESRPVPKLVLVSPKMADRTHQYRNLVRRRWGCAILDEAHTLTANAVRKDCDLTVSLMEILKAIPHRLLLTGTPAVAKTFDSYNQIEVLRPGLLGASKYAFKHRFFEQASGFAECKLPRQLPLLLHRFVMIRRTKAQVMQSLPERTDVFITLPVGRDAAKRLLAAYPLSAEQLAAADAASGPGGGEEEAEGGAAVADSLRVAGIKSTSHKVGLLKSLVLGEGGSWLHERLKRLVYNADEARQSQLPPRKLVLFAHHEKVMNALEQAINRRLAELSERGGGGDATGASSSATASPAAAKPSSAAAAAPWTAVRVDGSCLAQQKNELLGRFKQESSCLVALLSIRACGTGVDGLQTVADEAAFVELPETYALAQQAASRLHRSGQPHKVTMAFLSLPWPCTDDLLWPSAGLPLDLPWPFIR